MDLFLAHQSLLRHWHTLPPSSAGVLIKWLCREGSLTQHLVDSGLAPKVRILSQGYTRATQSEAITLGYRWRIRVWARQIVLSSNNVPIVFARSVMLPPAKRQAWRSVTGLGTQPLADILFRDPSISRSCLLSKRLLASDSLLAFVSNAGLERPQYARLSAFARQQQLLVLTEVFLPALQAQLARRR